MHKRPHILHDESQSLYCFSAILALLLTLPYKCCSCASSKRRKQRKNLHSLAKCWLCFLTQCHWTAFKRWYYLWLLCYTINTIIFPIKLQSELATFESVAHSTHRANWLGSSAKTLCIDCLVDCIEPQLNWFFVDRSEWQQVDDWFLRPFSMWTINTIRNFFNTIRKAHQNAPFHDPTGIESGSNTEGPSVTFTRIYSLFVWYFILLDVTTCTNCHCTLPAFASKWIASFILLFLSSLVCVCRQTDECGKGFRKQLWIFLFFTRIIIILSHVFMQRGFGDCCCSDSFAVRTSDL